MVSQTPASNPTNYFVHTLLRARDWQHRPEFDRLCDWWRGGGQGVCGLVGMGGAGKTAIVERFLRVLPGVMPQNPHIPKEKNLPTPNSTFVFSFYDAPNAEAFFQSLQMWLLQSPDVETTVSYSQLLFRMQNTAPGLIVLDGLEKVQEDGARGILGQLSAPNLRDFVKRAADGYFPQLSVLITTRFPLADLQEEQPDFFQSIPIEEIDTSTGVNLLRQRGVQGNDLQLERIVKECGSHALTVDLAGGYIKEYGNGDPNTPLDLGNATDIEDAVRQEQDPAKRAVLKQGFRFARVAQRYQEAMLEHDPAAIALLERICLFRLGVGVETLAAIFTGEAAVKVSGAALAGLNVEQLQRKLDWLVRMRIIEVTRIKYRQSGQIRTLYNIHPAVRDGFVQSIGRDIATVSHEAIRTGLEVSLGDSPGKNPSELATLDMLEEIVYHAIASGQASEAWNIYWNKIGGYRNLVWRLGAYERGERICRAFGGGQSPETVAALLREPHPSAPEPLPCLALSEALQANFINEWAMYLTSLGRLDAAACCFEAATEMAVRQENWGNASQGNQNLSEVWLQAGRLRLALTSAKEALRLAEQADDASRRRDSYAFQGAAQELLGAVSAALEDFRQCLYWQHQVDGDDNPLLSGRGIYHTLLLTRLGRHGEAQRLTEANKEILANGWGANHQDMPKCHLVLADLAGKDDIESARAFYSPAHNWALARDSKEILCWAALVKTRIELAEAEAEAGVRKQESGVKVEPLQTAQDALIEGLKIARDCRFGIYHIDLLLEQVHLHLLQGNPQAALADLRLALDDGIPANDQTGQPELLAAHDPECGYAWGIVEGLHRRGEALLLQAAQTLGEDSFVPARRTALPKPVQTLITQAEACLQEAMTHWRDLRDPEVSESNFIHPDTKKEYNYRAADTYQVLEDLKGGILTQYIKHQTAQGFEPEKNLETEKNNGIGANTEDTMSQEPTTVFISYSHDNPQHSKRVLNFANQLRVHGIDVELDQYHTRPTLGWPRWCEEKLRPDASRFVLMICTQTYLDRVDGQVPADEGRGVYWEGSFIFNYIYNRKENYRFIPILLPGSNESHIPMPLQGHSRYRINNFDLSDQGYQSLYRELTQQPAVTKPAIGQKVDLSSQSGSSIVIQSPVAARIAETEFETVTAPVVATNASASPKALALWQKKLDFLLQEEATLTDPDQKFRLQQLIEEAQQKIQKLGGSS